MLIVKMRMPPSPSILIYNFDVQGTDTLVQEDCDPLSFRITDVSSPTSSGDMSGSALQCLGTDQRNIANLLRGPRRLNRLSLWSIARASRANPRGAKLSDRSKFDSSLLVECLSQIS